MLKKYQDMTKQERAVLIIKTLRKATKGMVEPAATSIVARYGNNPFLVLISCILSLRTRDVTSLPASIRLFDQAKTPQELLKLPLNTIETLIYPVSFYRNKARTIHVICHDILTKFKGKVPHTEEELLSFKGVGRKTANLVLGEGFGIPAICVDTHVHKISNRLGLVETSTVEETEQELKLIVPKRYWIEYNRLLVMWGQNICVPISPFCSRCAIAPLCPRKGVTKHR